MNEVKSCEVENLLDHWHKVIYRPENGGVNVKRLTGEKRENGEPIRWILVYG